METTIFSKMNRMSPVRDLHEITGSLLDDKPRWIFNLRLRRTTGFDHLSHYYVYLHISYYL